MEVGQTSLVDSSRRDSDLKETQTIIYSSTACNYKSEICNNNYSPTTNYCLLSTYYLLPTCYIPLSHIRERFLLHYFPNRNNKDLLYSALIVGKQIFHSIFTHIQCFNSWLFIINLNLMCKIF